MNRSGRKKKITLYMPGSYKHNCGGERITIAEVMDITPENALKRGLRSGGRE